MILKKLLFKFIVFIISFFLVYIISYELKLSSVLISSIVGLIASYLLKHPYQAVSFCASFAGMCSYEINISALESIIMAISGAVIFLSLEKKFNGVGGKLGMIAFVSVFLSIIMRGVII